jgi:hypothetical protein
MTESRFKLRTFDSDTMIGKGKFNHLINTLTIKRERERERERKHLLRSIKGKLKG